MLIGQLYRLPWPGKHGINLHAGLWPYKNSYSF